MVLTTVGISSLFSARYFRSVVAFRILQLFEDTLVSTELLNKRFKDCPRQQLSFYKENVRAEKTQTHCYSVKEGNFISDFHST